ncbi:hypothetical protein AB0G54_23675 [Streptomyces yokosukanensis]|uniref:hypothetical protein n=1 Tax=Streptomyces yokosukanensis TaxID=67386 RepID=UPI003421503E
MACDGVGRPFVFTVTGGNTNDCTRFTAVTEAIRVPRTGQGRPRVRPSRVLGDKGYSSRAYAPGCVGAASATPFPSEQIRSATG